jgi:wyosine [tRNA(Phe)-imidazoG37] synthetase (radical SAM superfamily)
VDLVPPKTCPFDCLYCEVGRTTVHTERRGCFFTPDEIIGELETYFAEGGEADIITITGSGEPTLSVDIGDIIHECRERFGLPVAVITNGALLWDADVRRDLLEADIVMPSLDCAREQSFARLNRPAEGISLARYIEGLETFTREFDGRVWLEVLVAEGLNDSDEDIEALAAAIRRIEPDHIQMNTVVRPPADRDVTPVERERLEQIAERLARIAPVEIIAPVHLAGEDTETADLESFIVQTLSRRACTVDDIAGGLSLGRETVERLLCDLVEKGALRRLEYDGTTFYQAPEPT